MAGTHTNGALNPTKGDVARLVAKSHRDLDPSVTAIYRVESPGHEDDPSEPVKLIEVTPNTPASGIMPLYFGPHAPSGQVYPCIIMEVHTTEWDQLRAGQLRLPNDWRLGERLFQAGA